MKDLGPCEVGAAARHTVSNGECEFEVEDCSHRVSNGKNDVLSLDLSGTVVSVRKRVQLDKGGSHGKPPYDYV